MNKKHYEAIAQAIKENTTEITDFSDGDTYIMLSRTPFVLSLCDILKAENKNFNADKFREACK